MKKMKFSLMLLMVFMSLMINAQTNTDAEGRTVSIINDVYKMSWSAKSDNGGTYSETWTGPLKNGQRHGTWKYTRNVNRFMSDGAALTGTVVMVRNYKEGVPHGVYSYNSNIKYCSISFNVLNNTWVYGSNETITESVNGSFQDGSPNGAWTISSNTKGENLSISFVNGRANGTWKINNESFSTYQFRDGYLVYQKQPVEVSWGYETKYPADIDLETLEPKDTVLVANGLIPYLDYYMIGCGCERFVRYYPSGASWEHQHDKSTAYYILAAYKEYTKTYGNVPQHVLERIEYEKGAGKREALNKKYQAFKEQDSKYLWQIKDSIQSYMRNLSSDYVDFCERYDVLDYVEARFAISFCEKHPEFEKFNDEYTKFAEECAKSYGSRYGSYTDIAYFINDYCEKYEKLKPKYDTLTLSIINEAKQYGAKDEEKILAKAFRFYKTPAWNDYLMQVGEEEKRSKITIDEHDILIYLCEKYTTFTVIYGNVGTVSVTSTDASSVTRDDVLGFVCKHSDINGKRLYDKANKVIDNYHMNLEDILSRVQDRKRFKKLRETVSF